MKIYLIKTLQGLKPCYDSDDKNYQKLKLNEEYLAEITKPRNYKFHKKFFALLNLYFANQDEFDNFEDMRAITIMRAGFRREIIMDNEVLILPESINFENMDEYKFRDMYDNVLDVIMKKIKINNEQVEKELKNFM